MALGERARRSMPRGVPMAWMDDLYEHPPVWVARGEGPTFTDVDNHTYLDFYIADMSGFCGHAPAAVVAAVRRRMSLDKHRPDRAGAPRPDRSPNRNSGVG